MNKYKGDYGIDAPNVVRNLFLFSLVLFVLSIFSFQIQSAFWFWISFLYSILTSFALLITGCWMLYGIKVSKPKIASLIIQNLELKGNEKVLDMGCGRGLLLCEAAKQLQKGEAHGIDLWFNKDQSGNKHERTLENAELEGVGQQVTVHTGDVRALPFPEAYFDAVVSSLCLHNIETRKEREQALFEMLRVLKPNGKFAIADIQYGKEYAEFFKAHNMTINSIGPIYSYCPPITIIERCVESHTNP